ncbi:Outer membrane protein OmpA [Filimonas lacunae]|uniref:Outer membrane protein OmpA n=1 Tax=Filimonas lacunae TaxID=477680 RepID=A0A173MBV3_9BACT|nr:OmpA family protein [Filimonas lacunae]BAV04948.1 outer membrane lipoprotein omp16 precursor [Filimonas lacunae]SIT33742.1 Outer membrane protein OmpA [Filimonas lacunae]
MLTIWKKAGLLTGSCCLLLSWGRTQFVYDYLKAGDDYYEKADYASAAGYYEKYLYSKGGTGAGYEPYTPQPAVVAHNRKPGNQQKAQWMLAESYRQLRYTEKAENAYRSVHQLYGSAYPLAALRWAQQLRAMGNYSKADSMFALFLKNYTVKDEYAAMAERELASLHFAQEALQKGGAKELHITRQSGLLNSGGAFYAPSWLDANTLLLTSTRLADSAGGMHQNRLYTMQVNGAEAEQLQPWMAAPGSATEQGPATVSADGNSIYFTAWSRQDKAGTAIYNSRKVNGQWSSPVPLLGQVNVQGYSARQPFITPDGRFLYFSSNRLGGEGGFDIWYVSIDDTGRIGTPLNAGKQVNTAYDEQAPYYNQSEGELVFSSNGHIGMGGMDLYSSKGVPGSFEAPVNMGYPVNSVKDDVYFTIRSREQKGWTEAWIASDRAAACCLELFTVSRQWPSPPVAATVVTEDKPRKPDTIHVPAPELPVNGILSNVYYVYGKADLAPGSHASLDSLVQMLKVNTLMIIEISGHTDNIGSDEYNLQLSLSRAQSCIDYIIKKGINPVQLVARGYGAQKPVAPNKNADGSDNPEGRKLNRRTEFTILRR